MTSNHWLDLRRHPSTPSTIVRSVKAAVRRSPGAELQIRFRLDGNISQILIPSAEVLRMTEGLWRHTCFETFIAVDGQPAYHEFNFAPSGEWGVYAFSGYRKGGFLNDEAMRPVIETHSSDSFLELDAIVRLDRLSAAHGRGTLRIGLSAVVEASDGFSYWALRHFGEKPDFHNAEGFGILSEPASEP